MYNNLANPASEVVDHDVSRDSRAAPSLPTCSIVSEFDQFDSRSTFEESLCVYDNNNKEDF